MSHTIHIVAVPLPENTAEAIDETWQLAERLRSGEDAAPIDPRLQRFFDRAIDRFPDIIDPEPEPAVWAQSPMIACFGSKVAEFNILYSSIEQSYPFLLHLAADLGLTFVDTQSNDVIRPDDVGDMRSHFPPDVFITGSDRSRSRGWVICPDEKRPWWKRFGR